MDNHEEFLPEGAVEKIVTALGDAYYDNGGEYFRPEVGNTILSFAIAAWQSSLHNLEKAFPKTPGVHECIREGNVFYVQFAKCRVSFFKFRQLESASSFRLVGTSRNRERIVRHNQQLRLFDEPITSLIVIHTGTPEDGLLEVHIGAPISARRSDDGWVWSDEIFNQALNGVYEPANDRPTILPFTVLEEPTVELVPETEERPDIAAFTKMDEAKINLEEQAENDEDEEHRNS